MELILILIGICVVLGVIAWICENVRKANLYEQVAPKAYRYEQLKGRLDELERAEAGLKENQEQWAKKVQENREAMETLAREKALGFPWLAQAYAEYFHLLDVEAANYLEHKSPPARKAAETTREIAGRRRNAEKLWRILKYQLEYYESLFPWLIDFKGEDLDDLVRQLTAKTEEMIAGEDRDDPVRHWLTPAEYRALPSAERNQLALDRYWQKKKSRWELGRDYERFIGYEYEAKGWQVRYQGIVEGLADLGRDLIARKGNTADVVQCKYWSKYKTIHEKHIFQLFGTAVAYRIDHPRATVSAVFVTSTRVSERAKQFGNELGVALREEVALSAYPCIKCNVSKKDGTKIYHLPLDQQYDRTVIEQQRNERYVSTVAEAERLGFRRAFRWRGPRAEDDG